MFWRKNALKKKKKMCFLAESSKNKTKKNKKNIFSPIQAKIRLKNSVFLVFRVLGSNVRGKKILFSFHILSRWTETYPKMYSTSLYLLGGGHNPPPGMWYFFFTWPFQKMSETKKMRRDTFKYSELALFFQKKSIL